jgi:hypothetical protein
MYKIDYNKLMKNNLKVYYLLAVIVALVLVGIYYWSNKQAASDMETLPEEEMVACTMDAKICPDGSAVGRSGPKCEFTPCPGE